MFKSTMDEALNRISIGDSPRWTTAYNDLEDFETKEVYFDRDAITTMADITDEQRTNLKENLKKFIPWRKGPFNIHGVEIDTEWRSCLKWDRLKNYISPLAGRRVADIGGGNAYYCFRMLDQKPKSVINFDPSSLFLHQFLAIQKYVKADNLNFYPVGIEALNDVREAFDSVFFMGVLYHRKAPVECLKKLAQTISSGGELILETISIAGEGNYCLSPLPRYAKMPNVYFLPTNDCLCNWLEQSGFVNPKVVSIEKTSIEEQRKTEWSYEQSLEDFLDPNDSSKTVEGYPAPQRTVIIAQRKNYRA